MTAAEWKLKVDAANTAVQAASVPQEMHDALLKMQRLTKWFRWWMKARIDGDTAAETGIEEEWAAIEASGVT